MTGHKFSTDWLDEFKQYKKIKPINQERKTHKQSLDQKRGTSELVPYIYQKKISKALRIIEDLIELNLQRIDVLEQKQIDTDEAIRLLWKFQEEMIDDDR